MRRFEGLIEVLVFAMVTFPFWGLFVIAVLR